MGPNAAWMRTHQKCTFDYKADPADRKMRPISITEDQGLKTFAFRDLTGMRHAFSSMEMVDLLLRHDCVLAHGAAGETGPSGCPAGVPEASPAMTRLRKGDVVFGVDAGQDAAEMIRTNGPRPGTLDYFLSRGCNLADLPAKVSPEAVLNEIADRMGMRRLPPQTADRPYNRVPQGCITGSDARGGIAREQIPDSAAGCRLGCACAVHRPTKPAPYIPAIDEFDLLPDAP